MLTRDAQFVKHPKVLGFVFDTEFGDHLYVMNTGGKRNNFLYCWAGYTFCRIADSLTLRTGYFVQCKESLPGLQISFSQQPSVQNRCKTCQITQERMLYLKNNTRHRLSGVKL